MNIIEAYIKKYKQLIIVILGLPCTNKSDIAKELSIDTKLKIIKLNDYLIPDKYIEKNIEGIKFKIYEDPNNYNWDKLNKDINEFKNNGVIIYGNYIDITKIDWEIDFSFFYSMNNTLCKKILIEKKMLESEISDIKTKIYFEKIFNPIYNKIKESIKINKFYNIKEDNTFDNSYNEIFDYLMRNISIKLK